MTERAQAGPSGVWWGKRGRRGGGEAWAPGGSLTNAILSLWVGWDHLLHSPEQEQPFLLPDLGKVWVFCRFDEIVTRAMATGTARYGLVRNFLFYFLTYSMVTLLEVSAITRACKGGVFDRAKGKLKHTVCVGDRVS